MKKGSALLIVLGMVAFMIVSAVAFASYMRFSRMPSNFLRRTSSSRLLVKAALARAIDAVDRGVSNNLHPGVGNAFSGGDYDNSWLHRVFFGSKADFCNSFEEGLVRTVSVLTLEGLAYIPPPLVNDVRYYSRLTKTAVWQNLGFDTGRYAFCAVDVSDYFDVNRLMADKPRSSAPNNRVSLAYLFEDKDHMAVGPGAKQWDEWMANFRTVDDATGEISWGASKYPFVSLADFNLALGHQGGVGDMKSYFYDYVDSGAGNGGFYGNLNVSEFYKAQRMTFVTDGLFPAETYSDDLDLNNPVHQPFKAAFLEKANPALGGAIFGTADAMQDSSEWLNRLSGVGCAALYDYLDEDHVPLSLAIPTVERAPMICGIQPGFSGGRLGIVREYAKEEGPEGGNQPESLTIVSGGGEAETKRVVRKTILYRLDPITLGQGFTAGNLRALAAFPFNHASDDDATPFKVDGRLSLFFTYGDASMGLRSGFDNDALQLPQNIEAGLNAEKGLMNLRFEPQNLKFAANSRIESCEDAVDDSVDFPLISGREVCTKLNEAGNELLKVTYEWPQIRSEAGAGVMTSWEPAFEAVKGDAAKIATVEMGLKSLDAATGKPIDDNEVKGALTGNGLTLRLNVAVWLRVTDSESHVVDLVPACLEDDSVMNPSTTGEDRYSTILKGAARNGDDNDLCGKPYPLLRFDVENGALTLTIQDLVQALDAGSKTWEGELSLKQKAILVADPRYNYAPEHWFAVTAGGVIDKSTWLEGNNQVARGDGDIFLSVSDAGHLQSKYELAFIPRLTDHMEVPDSLARGKLVSPARGFGGGKSLATSFAQTSNQELMWRTYDPVGTDYEAFESLPWTNEGTGLKVNPYSDTTNVLMAAFANTPADWTHASTNVIRQIKENMTATDFNKRFALNSYSDDLHIAWEDLEGLAGSLIDAVREGPNGTDWETAWNTLWKNKTELDAQDGIVRLMDWELSDDTDRLWNVDRKFLYGFWKDCFAARQQLFLVFVRAEPMMMGGGANGQIPPQLGGRAVALVWRDPAASPNNDDPHRTRVLFYRQLD